MTWLAKPPLRGGRVHVAAESAVTPSITAQELICPSPAPRIDKLAHLTL